MDILQQKLIGYPSRVNYTKIIENCETRQRDYFKTRTFYTYIHIHIYIFFLFFLTNFPDLTRVKRRKGTIFLLHDSESSSLFPNAYPVHMCATLLAPKFIANPSPFPSLPPSLPSPRFPPHPFHHDHRCLHLHHASSYTAFHRPSTRSVAPSPQHFVPVFSRSF